MLRGDRVKQRRIQLNISQDDLAKRVGTSQNRVSKYERGVSDANGDTVAALARSLETSSDWLLGLTDDPSPSTKMTELAPKERQAIALWRRGDITEAIKVMVSG